VTDEYQIILTSRAKRDLTETLPAKIAAAAYEFIVGPLARNPHRVGKPLREPFAGLYAARRGDYRITYLIDDHRVIVEVVTIRHRRDAYRT
jgi:mRNA interferase RelE/StbE